MYLLGTIVAGSMLVIFLCSIYLIGKCLPDDEEDYSMLSEADV